MARVKIKELLAVQTATRLRASLIGISMLLCISSEKCCGSPYLADERCIGERRAHVLGPVKFSVSVDF